MPRFIMYGSTTDSLLLNDHEPECKALSGKVIEDGTAHFTIEMEIPANTTDPLVAHAMSRRTGNMKCYVLIQDPAADDWNQAVGEFFAMIRDNFDRMDSEPSIDSK